MWKTLTRLRHAGSRGLIAGFLAGPLLFGCVAPSVPILPIPMKVIPAPNPGTSGFLVIVLPGRGDDLDDLSKTGITEAVQKSWPEADVLLTGATLGYYSDGKIAERLHDQIIQAARQRGYREIWLTGASMGGMGALLYERVYPHDITGLVLYAPYMGEPSLVKAVAGAGGPAAWDPGPLPAALDSDNYQRELWRLVKGWQDPEEARRIWLVCGDQDRLLAAAKLMVPLLPPGHFIETAGGHDWPIWDAGAVQVFAHIAALPR